MRTFLCLGAVAMMLANTALGNDTSGMREEIADLRAKVAALESTQMAPAAGGDAASLTSMRKKGMIKIGGKVETAVIIAHRDDRASVDAGQDDEVTTTTFGPTSGELNFKIEANSNMGAVIKLDIDDAWDEPDLGELDQDDFLEEMYFYFKKVMDSNWGVKFGKKEVPFGTDKDVLILPAVTNTSAHFIAYNRALVNQGNWARNGMDTLVSVDNPHNDPTGRDWWPTEVDNRFQIAADWKYKDLLTLEMAVFQNVRTLHEDRSDDHLGLESYSARIKLMPLEGLTLQTSFMNQHWDAGQDGIPNGANTKNIENGEDNQKSFSFGIDYKVKSLPIELFAEYLHGWDGDYNNQNHADVVQLGLIWGVTEVVDLVLTGNYVGIEQDGAVGGNVDQEWDDDLYSFQIGVIYKLEGNIQLHVEYQHDWYDYDIQDGDNYNQNGDALAFGVQWKF